MELMNNTIQTFNMDYYSPTIDKPAFNITCVDILQTNNCGKIRHEDFEGRRKVAYAKRHFDYYERLYFQFWNQKSKLNNMAKNIVVQGDSIY